MNRRTARFQSPYPFASTSLAALASVLLAAAAPAAPPTVAPQTIVIPAADASPTIGFQIAPASDDCASPPCALEYEFVGPCKGDFLPCDDAFVLAPGPISGPVGGLFLPLPQAYACRGEKAAEYRYGYRATDDEGLTSNIATLTFDVGPGATNSAVEPQTAASGAIAGIPADFQLEVDDPDCELATQAVTSTFPDIPGLPGTPVASLALVGAERRLATTLLTYRFAPHALAPPGYYPATVSVGDAQDPAQVDVEIPLRIYSGSQLGSFDDQLAERALVVYNEHDPEAEAIADYYAFRRDVPDANVCPVRTPTGLYATKDEMLSLRRQILEDCICANVLPGLPDCDLDHVDTVAQASPITHLVLIRGLPTRLYRTGFNGPGEAVDGENPSLDYFLSSMLYRDDAVFPDPAPGPYVPWEPPFLDPTHPEWNRYRPSLDAGSDRIVAYGRVEAIDQARTLDLIDRTLAAEAEGLQGSFLSELPTEFVRMREVTASFDAACTDYISTFPSATWDFATCRAGTTYSESSDPGTDSGQVPGEPNATIAQAIDTAVFLGTHAGPPDQSDPTRNQQYAFDGFENMLDWRKSDAPCEPLCADTADPGACSAASTDYFRELDTSCVGAAPGFVGFQLRSVPVAYYGFYPAGWDTPHKRAIERSPPVPRTGGAFSDPPFDADDRYLHFGGLSAAPATTPMCPNADGSALVACPEAVTVKLNTTVELSPAIPLDAPRSFTIVLRHRNQANPGRGRIRVTLGFSDGSGLYTADNGWNDSPFELAHPTWSESQIQLQAHCASPCALVGPATSVNVAFGIDLPALGQPPDVAGFLDLDGIELIDDQTGVSLMDVRVGSFDPPLQDQTHFGDWASNAIDRLGAVAWWGSSSHFATGGNAFKVPERMLRSFLSGLTLGESVLAGNDATSQRAGPESGIVYGDPLYRPSAAVLFQPWAVESERYPARLVALQSLAAEPDPPGLCITPENEAQSSVIMASVLQGTDHLATTQYSLSTCFPAQDFSECDTTQPAMWNEDAVATGSFKERFVDWTQLPSVDLSENKKVVLRLSVWNDDPATAFHDFAYFDYRGHPVETGDLQGAWESACQTGALDLEIRVDVVGNTFTERSAVFAPGAGCAPGAELVRTEVTGALTMESSSCDVEGATKFRIQHTGYTATPSTPLGAALWNGFQVCGLSDWAWGVTKDLLDEDGCSPQIADGSFRYDIVELTPSAIRLGERLDFFHGIGDPDRRPQSFLSFDLDRL